MEMLHRKSEIGKISNSWTPFLNCTNKNTIIVIGKNKHEKSRKFKFLLQTRLKELLFVTSVGLEALLLSNTGLNSRPAVNHSSFQWVNSCLQISNQANFQPSNLLAV